MSILILTEGGEDSGLGHVTRCASLCQAFREMGVASRFVVNGDKTVESVLRDENYKFFDWLAERQLLLELLNGTDIAVIDSYHADYELYEDISKSVKTAVYFDDESRFEYPKGFVLNASVSAGQMPYPEREGVTYLLGAQYAPLRKEFWDVNAKPIRNNPETIMITFGGADTHGLTPGVLKLLISTYPEVLKKVIIGKGFQNIEEIEELKDNSTELVYFPSAVDMKNVMLESDIAITTGGQTVYELARVGTPAIGICMAKNQLRSIKCWSELGFMEYVGWYNCKKLEQELKNRLEHLEVRHIRMGMSETGRKIIDGQGCKRILNAIELNKQVGEETPN